MRPGHLSYLLQHVTWKALCCGYWEQQPEPSLGLWQCSHNVYGEELHRIGLYGGAYLRPHRQSELTATWTEATGIGAKLLRNNLLKKLSWPSCNSRTLLYYKTYDTPTIMIVFWGTITAKTAEERVPQKERENKFHQQSTGYKRINPKGWLKRPRMTSRQKPKRPRCLPLARLC